MQTYLNGDVVQDGSTADLIFDIPTLIAHVSSVMTLLPGDVILTGTPEGVGPMQVGDEVEVADRGARLADQHGGQAMSERLGRRPRPVLPLARPARPHVGFARTALYNWAFARHHGGTFVFRIEDTDKERSTEESYDAMLDAMRWLGLDWDEGPEVGGPHAPYRQSERGDLYPTCSPKLRRVDVHLRLLLHHRGGRRPPQGVRLQGAGVRRLLPRAHRRAASRRSRPRGASRWCGSGCPTARSPGTTWSAARSPSRPQYVPDFALCRANGDPLYTLVNPVDDALMGITHVLRGEDLLSSTPRQIPLHRALVELGHLEGGAGVRAPAARHGRGQQEALEAGPAGAPVHVPRRRASCPRGCSTTWPCSGWAIGPDRDVFTLEEMVDAFDIKDVNPNPARFDLKKAEAINADHMRMLSIEELTHRVVPFLQAAGVLTDPVDDADAQLLELAMPLVAERMNKLTEAATDARLPVRRRGVVRADRRARRRRARRRTRGARGARRRWSRGRPPTSRRPCARRSSRSSGSSRGWRSARSGSR